VSRRDKLALGLWSAVLGLGCAAWTATIVVRAEQGVE